MSDTIRKPVEDIRRAREILGENLELSELSRWLKKLASPPRKGLLPERHERESREQQLAFLKKALQAAVTLEYATIPPYLCALWSIKDELHPVAKSIREVVQEEMLHMALVCNMLTSLGETPKITDAVVSYPGPLPGGVHKGLIVKLAGLSKKQLSDFLWIERPVKEVPIEHPYPEDCARSSAQLNLVEAEAADETIGEFYESIRTAFKAYLKENPDSLSPDRQVTGPLAYAVIRGMDDVNYAIDLIKDQGEGSSNDPRKTDGEFSHYYRFLEIRDERKYQWDEASGQLEIVGEFEFPEVWPMAPVPEGGYKRDDVVDNVWYYIDQFDSTYSKLLDQLQQAWAVGGQASLVHAYETMFALQKSAKWLMQTRTPFGAGATYGPCFRYKSNSER